tara:strand:- start:175 stop:588 length:414 start_codon:yes stop_codon:yes gene_type:complete
MLLNTKENWQPEQADIIQWGRTYPAVDVDQELMAMESWLDANPTKRKTKGGIKRFVNSWLSRSQDRGGSSPAVIGTQAQAAKLDPQGITAAPISLKSLTFDMQLTDITWLDPQDAQEMKQYYIDQRGFYFDGVLRNA